MRKVSQKAKAVLDVLAGMAKDNGGHIKIEEGKGFMPVSVEWIGCNCLSVAHYGEQNGDLMRDPDMVFWRGADSNWYPASFRNDYAGVYQESLVLEGGLASKYAPRLQRDHAIFAAQWMENIRQQQGLSLLKKSDSVPA